MQQTNRKAVASKSRGEKINIISSKLIERFTRISSQPNAEVTGFIYPEFVRKT